ncbi:MAG TPA: Ig-like domain-containing protein [Verrucomicrobiae bacterium]|nr:Ig-like domain-containing protein [Verrucomicrobiae bacterium]
MQPATRQATLLLIVSLLAIAGALHAQPYITVTDDGFSFSPDPVYIVTGQAVYWVDDGSGPYTIFSRTSAWSPVTTPGGVLFSVAGTYQYFDDAGDQGTVYVTANVPPTVAITSPTNNAVFTAPASFTFSANASDSDADGLSNVVFYVGTNLVDDVFASPFEVSVTNLVAGSYTLTVVAYDNVGATSSDSVNILVQNSGPIILTALTTSAGQFQFTAAGLTTGKTNILQSSTNLMSSANWTPISTNIAGSSSASFTNTISGGNHFFRLLQLP